MCCTMRRAHSNLFFQALTATHSPRRHVYLSDAIGTNFSLSLPNNARDSAGDADFARVHGLEGIYIANPSARKASHSESSLFPHFFLQKDPQSKNHANVSPHNEITLIANVPPHNEIVPEK